MNRSLFHHLCAAQERFQAERQHMDPVKATVGPPSLRHVVFVGNILHAKFVGVFLCAAPPQNVLFSLHMSPSKALSPLIRSSYSKFGTAVLVGEAVTHAVRVGLATDGSTLGPVLLRYHGLTHFSFFLYQVQSVHGSAATPDAPLGNLCPLNFLQCATSHRPD